jgi:hypothetical protein
VLGSFQGGPDPMLGAMPLCRQCWRSRACRRRRPCKRRKAKP